ncbi:MAG TPA: hypothetical protein ENN41_00395 [Sediminispirochaeta sp.]|nr:hypothetical protein [Sediminispirochaeta sp.]
MAETPDQKLLRLLSRLQAQEAQNRLLRLSDRDLAISMLYLDEMQRNLVLSLLGNKKRERVEQEQRYVSRLRLTYSQYRVVIDRVNRYLEHGGQTGLSSYIRPRRL